MAGPRIGVVGATGAVGTITLELLAERGYDVRAFASARSAGSRLPFGDDEILVEEATAEALSAGDVDLFLFSVGTGASRELVPVASAAGAICIDKSSAYRLVDGYPLVVPGGERRIGRSRRSSATGSSPTRTAARSRSPACSSRCTTSCRSSASTSRPISPSPAPARSGWSSSAPSRPAEHNLVMDWSWEGDESDEESKLRAETRKILELPDLAISATCVRVPVLVGHSEAIWVEFEEPLSPGDATAILSEAPSVRVLRLPEFPTPGDAAGGDEVLVGRIRGGRGIPERPRALPRLRQPAEGRGPERDPDRRGAARRCRARTAASHSPARLPRRPLRLRARHQRGAAGSVTRPPTLIAVGDIASCSSNGDEQTAALVSTLRGPIAVLGDIAYDNGTADDFANCFDPSWGRLVPRIRAALGNHEYNSGTAAVAIERFRLPPNGWYSYARRRLARDRAQLELRQGRWLQAGSPQWRWLRGRSRRRTRPRCTLAYWHHPRFSSGPHGSDAANCAVLGSARAGAGRRRPPGPRPRLRALRSDSGDPLVRRRHRRQEPVSRPSCRGPAASFAAARPSACSASRSAPPGTAGSSCRLQADGSATPALPRCAVGALRGRDRRRPGGVNASWTTLSTRARRPSSTGARPASSRRQSSTFPCERTVTNPKSSSSSRGNTVRWTKSRSTPRVAFRVPVGERLQRPSTLVPGLADRSQEQRLLDPFRTFPGQVRAGHEDGIVRRRPRREIRCPGKEPCRPVLHRSEHGAVVVEVDRPPLAGLVLDPLHPALLRGRPVPPRLPPDAVTTDRRSAS